LVPAIGPQFGSPLPGLTAKQLEAFAEGLEEFQNEDAAESGLGPTFNDVSCAACHSEPAIGGTSTKFVTRFGREVNGEYDPLVYLGGSLLQSQAIHPDVPGGRAEGGNTHRVAPHHAAVRIRTDRSHSRFCHSAECGQTNELGSQWPRLDDH
jgi:hypothetical protein